MTPPRPAVSWAIIAVACIGIIVGNVALGVAEYEADDTTRLILLRLQGKVLLGASTLQPTVARRQLAALDEEAVTPALARAMAALHAAIDNPDDGPSVAALELLHRERDVVQAADEISLHDAVERAVIDPAALSPDDRSRVLDAMGWFGRVLLCHRAPSDDAERREILGEALRATAAVTAVVLAGGIGVLAGIVLLVVAAARRRDGGLRFGFRPPVPFGPWYLRAFALYLALFFGLQILPVVVGVRFADVLAFGGLIVSSAVGVTWPMVRGVPPRDAFSDLGLHRGRGVLREVASGVVGYAAILPIFAVGFVATLVLMALWSAIAPSEGGPVSHPVIEMIAEGDTAVRLALLFLASGFAPFFEETLFRGALYGDLRRRFGPVASGVLMGTLFAAIHPQGLLTVPALTALAFGFAMLREWRGSLIAPMVAHAIHNGTLVGLTWFLIG